MKILLSHLRLSCYEPQARGLFMLHCNYYTQTFDRNHRFVLLLKILTMSELSINLSSSLKKNWYGKMKQNSTMYLVALIKNFKVIKDIDEHVKNQKPKLSILHFPVFQVIPASIMMCQIGVGCILPCQFPRYFCITKSPHTIAIVLFIRQCCIKISTSGAIGPRRPRGV